MGVRGCVNAMCLSSRYDTPRLARKLTFLRPTRPSKEQIAKFDSTSKVFFFFLFHNSSQECKQTERGQDIWVTRLMKIGQRGRAKGVDRGALPQAGTLRGPHTAQGSSPECETVEPSLVGCRRDPRGSTNALPPPPGPGPAPQPQTPPENDPRPLAWLVHENQGSVAGCRYVATAVGRQLLGLILRAPIRSYPSSHFSKEKFADTR